jgi:hypothetical protein
MARPTPPPPPLPRESRPASTAQTRREEAALDANSRFHFTDRRLGLIFAFMALLIGVGSFGTGTLVNRSNRNSPLIAQTARIVKNSDETLDIIRDSVEPEGARFKRGQAATAAAVASITDATQIAVYCGQRERTLEGIRTCVQSEFSKLRAAAAQP